MQHLLLCSWPRATPQEVPRHREGARPGPLASHHARPTLLVRPPDAVAQRRVVGDGGGMRLRRLRKVGVKDILQRVQVGSSPESECCIRR